MCQICMSFLFLLKQNTTHSGAYNDTNFSSYSSGGQKSQAGLTGLIKVSTQLLLRGSRGELICLPFPASEGHPHSLFHGYFHHLQSQQHRAESILCCHLSGHIKCCQIMQECNLLKCVNNDDNTMQ